MHFFDLTQSKFAHVSKVQKVIYNLKLVWFNQVIFKRKKKNSKLTLWDEVKIIIKFYEVDFTRLMIKILY